MAESEIRDLDGVGAKTEQQLNDAGISSLNDLVDFDVDELSEESGLSESKSERLIKRAKERALLVQRGTDVEEEYAKKERRTSGIEPLDELMGGGYRDGQLVGVAGGSDSGKTQLGFYSLVKSIEETEDENGNLNGAGVYIETEKDRFEPERLRSLADHPDTYDNIIRIPCHGEDQLDKLLSAYSRIPKIPEEFDDIEQVVMVVVDSFVAPFRLSERFTDRSGLPQRNTEFAKHLNSLISVTEEVQCPALLIRQVYGNPDGWGSGKVTWGGDLIDHQLNFRLKLRDAEGELKKVMMSGHSGEGSGEVYMSIQDDKLAGYDEI